MPLIAAKELLDQIGDDALRIVDCRWYLGKPTDGRDAYEAGHIPGAVYGDLETDLSAPANGGRHPLPGPEAFGATLQRWDISENTRVVAYDDRGGAIAARLWWMLTQQGHAETYVLNGGLQAWLAAGGQLTTDEPVRDPHADSYPIVPSPWEGTADLSDVAGRTADVVVGDARSADRYRGETEPVDAKAGHIPGAISFPMTSNLDGLEFMQPEALRDAYIKAGIDEATDVIMHCGSGVTACHNILAMEIAGLSRPRLYVGSWSDWSASNEPIAAGPDPY